jgi:hypothetical protein
MLECKRSKNSTDGDVRRWQSSWRKPNKQRANQHPTQKLQVMTHEVAV